MPSGSTHAQSVCVARALCGVQGSKEQMQYVLHFGSPLMMAEAVREEQGAELKGATLQLRALQ